MAPSNNFASLTQTSEQIKTLTERYNKLALESEKVRGQALNRNSEMINLRNEIQNEIITLRNHIREIDSMINLAQSSMKSTSSKFKTIAKKDSYEKLKRRVDNLKYEEFMTRKELEKR